MLPGPVVTRFEMQPAPGVRAQKITTLAKDLARSLAVISVRVVEVIPGKSVIGIEIPNENREMVRLKELFATSEYEKSKSPLTLALGKDVAGAPVVTDISRMPHLLIAGTTGSGKSVGVNAMLISILYKASAEDVRLILVDPKMLELAVYEGIPHLLAPVVTDMSQAGHALNWCVAEMERRYRLMAALGVRNLAGFNKKVRDAQKKGAPLTDPLAEEDGLEDAPELGTLPFIVVVIDEFADMMMVARKQVEQLIAPHRPKGPRRRHPLGARHPTPVGGCDHRPHQGQHPGPHQLSGFLTGRLRHHSRPRGCRAAAWPRRHAVPAARHQRAEPGPWGLRL